MTRTIRQPLNLLSSAIDAQAAKLSPDDRVKLLHALSEHLDKRRVEASADAEESQAEEAQEEAE